MHYTPGMDPPVGCGGEGVSTRPTGVQTEVGGCWGGGGGGGWKKTKVLLKMKEKS